MKSWLLFYTITLICTVNISQDKELIEVRDLYYKACQSKDETAALYSCLVRPPHINKDLLEGYMGTYYMMRAKHLINPYKKLGSFSTGKELLDGAIKNYPASIELRFLRFCIQINCPSFLGYSSNITEDKMIMLKTYQLSTDADLRKRIKEYFVDSYHCTAAEKKLLE